MDLALTLALVLPWGVIAFQAWLMYVLVRQHGRALVNQDELRDRLAGAERSLGELAGKLDAVSRGAAADPHAGHDHGSHQAPEGLPIGSPAPEFRVPDLKAGSGSSRTSSASR